MERTLQLHGAVRPEEDVKRTRPLTGGAQAVPPPPDDGKSGLAVELVTGLLSRLADLHEHYSAVADGQRDAGGAEGGRLLGELDTAVSALTTTCSPASHSQMADAGARMQGEARNASLAISTALAMSGSGAGAEDELKAQIQQAQAEAAGARKREETAQAQAAREVAALQGQLNDKAAEVVALQQQLLDVSRNAQRLKDQDASAAAQDLMAAAKTTALEAANAELRCGSGKCGRWWALVARVGGSICELVGAGGTGGR